MPKNYQISQYDEPLCVDGYLDVDGRRRDTASASRASTWRRTPARTLHVGGATGASTAPNSLVDYNRAGVPLVEIVTEPDIRLGPRWPRPTSPSCATILRALGV